MSTQQADNPAGHSRHRPHHSTGWGLAGVRLAPLGLLLLATLLLQGCDKPRSVLEQVLHDKQLVVITRNSPTTYYEGPDGLTGVEYDLAKRFADSLGVRLKLILPDSFSSILPMVERGEAHFAAAGLSITESRKQHVRFGPAYQDITAQLVYRAGGTRPEDISDLDGSMLEVVAGSSHAERLNELKRDHPELQWWESKEHDSEELLYLTWQRLLDYTIADSNEVALNQRHYPELRVAFDIGEPQQLAWAFPRMEDSSLFDKAVEFFHGLEASGELAQLIERYYGHTEDFDYVETRAFMRHIGLRLPKYQRLFEQAAEKNGFDWRLLAAAGYQESHWNPHAISPTGVRGIMMLTQSTASQVGIKNRLDAKQSIMGGAQYLARIHSRIPARIQEPDRTWLALAAYNVGFAHLEDARRLTEASGGDPDKWMDVKAHLPLLSKKKWYKQTRHGYARGREPVHYVENIRQYYDILVRATSEPVEVVEEPSALNITSPVL